MKKYAIFLISASLLLACIFFVVKKEASEKAFKYFYIYCSIFDRDGKLIFSLNQNAKCAFHNDGSLLVTQPSQDKLELFDKNDLKLWSAHVNAHHDLKFSKDGKRILLITSEVSSFNNLKIRSDCFSVRSLTNQPLHQWCLKDHLRELNNLGIRIYKFGNDQDEGLTEIVTTRLEISHANSIYEIEENARSSSDIAFKKGNFLVNLNLPICASLILDPKMKIILWSKNFCQQRRDMTFLEATIHDPQVTKDGNLLLYVNAFNKYTMPYYQNLKSFKNVNPVSADSDTADSAFDIKNIFKINLKYWCCRPSQKEWYSRLMEIDPYTNAVYWSYKGKPPMSFKSPIVGSVTKLDNGNYLFSDITYGGHAFEITSNGKKTWGFTYPFRNAAGLPLEIDQIKPLMDLSFLKARHLIENNN